MDREKLEKALSVAVATKATWWMTNHHTGGAKDNEIRVDDINWVEAVNRLGHYYSTKSVLALASFPNISETEGWIEASNTVTHSDDAKLRFAGMPAGTARCNIAYESARRLVKNHIAVYTPHFSDYSSIAVMRKRIMVNPAQYHTGANFLTGSPRVAYQDTIYSAMLGILGTFVLKMLPKSSVSLASMKASKQMTEMLGKYTHSVDILTLSAVAKEFNCDVMVAQKDVLGITDEMEATDPESEYPEDTVVRFWRIN